MSGPLAGCRVLDLGIITAGAATAALLADLGAEVIKIESPNYRDPFRRWTSSKPSAESGPPFFRATNRNKTGISLDLKSKGGRDTFLKLLETSDVVLENFRRGAMKGIGLDFPALQAVNPKVILASISSQGETGPDANYVSFGSTLEAMGGLAWLTGYAGGQPVISGRDLNYPDQVVAIFAAGMVVTAWLNRARENGVHLDLSQRELTSFLLGDAFADSSAVAARDGNGEAGYAVQDCFRTADGAWLALSVEPSRTATFDEIVGMGQPRSESARRWIAAQPLAAALERFARAGIAAAAALNGAEVLSDRGGRWRNAMAGIPGGILAKGFPFQFDARPLGVHRDAPGIGADTRQVLREIAGFSAEEIDRLVASGAAELEQE